jgi:hypothetical protein
VVPGRWNVLQEREAAARNMARIEVIYAGLRRWAHILGFGGHFLTKSRRYSITFRFLGDQRIVWRRTVDTDLDDEHEEQTTLLIATLRYAGSGWLTLGDALLANTSAALARERQRIGRIEATSLN